MLHGSLTTDAWGNVQTEFYMVNDWTGIEKNNHPFGDEEQGRLIQGSLWELAFLDFQ